MNSSRTRRALLLAVLSVAASAVQAGEDGRGRASDGDDDVPPSWFSPGTQPPHAERLADLIADVRARSLLMRMTHAEKIQLVHGVGYPPPVGVGMVKGIARLGIPDIGYADSTAGVRVTGRNASALPSTLALAASWDPSLARDYGSLIAKEARILGYAGALGGGLNLAREPRGGRTFEYLGEDPLLAGTLVAARTQATQAQKVIGTIKHFAANNEETNRFYTNSVIAERPLRELYLRGFEMAVHLAQPGDVMCAYNLLNGEKACENRSLLTDTLKKEWGFKGFVQSDWFAAIFNTVRAANAGTDEEQAGSLNDYVLDSVGLFTHFNQRLDDAIKAGEVSAQRLDDMVLRKLRTLARLGILDSPPPSVPGSIDTRAGDAVALDVAQRSMVLLKNVAARGDREAVLPLSASKIRRIAVIGGNADAGVISGGGSGSVPPREGASAVACLIASTDVLGPCASWYHAAPLAGIAARLPGAEVRFLDGRDTAAAAAAAAEADVAVIFATQFTREGLDLPDLALPDNVADPANQAYDQNGLIKAVSERAKRTVVVLETGTAVTMPWLDSVHAVLQAWYPGMKGGEAIASLLFGEINPSGKLPLSFPRRESDLPQKTITPNPSTPRTVTQVNYAEGLKMGYRWYDAEGIEPLFPFGHGLSYTRFAYSGLRAQRIGRDDVRVRFTIRNTGERAGAEVAQVYASLPAASGDPPQRLVGWQKLTLQPGEARTVELILPAARFAIWDGGWQVPQGRAVVRVGGSSRDPNALRDDIELQGKRVAHAE